MEKQVLKYKDKIITLSFKQFEDEIDVDTLLQINHQRLAAEMITFPVILNRLGFLLSDANNKVKEASLDLEISTAKKAEEIRIKLLENKRTSKHTDSDLTIFQKADLRTDATLKVKSIILIKAQKEQEMVSSLYWAAKDKSDKLNKLSEKLHSGDMEYDLNEIKGTINGIKIGVHNPKF